VFAARRLVSGLAEPLAMVCTGLLADHLFEPGMMPGGRLANVFGGLVGTGTGAGMALLLVFSGIGGGLVALFGYLIPSVRNLESQLPDHNQIIDPALQTD
jgi:hypothetical protein